MIAVVVFCEYVIIEPFRQAFTEWAKSCPDRWQEVELLENIDQSGVYLEMWTADSAAEIGEWKKERREGRSWQEMLQWVKGGREGLRIWTFRPVMD